MFFVGVVNILAAFNIYVLASNVNIFAGNYFAAGYISIIFGFKVYAAFNAANGRADVFNILVGVFVTLFFAANSNTKSASGKNAALFNLLNIFTLTGLLLCAYIKFATGFNIYIIICNYVTCRNISISTACCIYATAGNIRTNYGVKIAVIVNIFGCAAENTGRFFVFFMQAFMVFVFGSNIYFVTSIKRNFAFFARYIAAFNINVIRSGKCNILFAGNISAYYGFINFAVMVIITASTVTYFTFLAVKVFNGTYINIVASRNFRILRSRSKHTAEVYISACIKADVIPAKYALLVFYTANFRTGAAISYCNVFFIGNRGNVYIITGVQA